MTIFDSFKNISGINPDMVYAGKCSNSTQSTMELMESYLNLHSRAYLADLDELDRLNGKPLSRTIRAFVSVVGFNEEKNIRNLIGNYRQQIENGLREDQFEIVYMLNYPDDGTDTRRNVENRERFCRGLTELLRLQGEMKNLHVIPKAFQPSVAGLSRARKYALDYPIFRMVKYNYLDADYVVIISNEGDMLMIPANYLQMYIDIFKDTKRHLFVQGAVKYPQEILNENDLFRTFAVAREETHRNLGLFSHVFSAFGGIMPIGRNYAVSPRVYAQVGGIDPTSRKEADDDMTFGWDITNVLGEKIKIVSDNPVCTNPRRELGIIEKMIRGDLDNMFDAYVNFHGNQSVYDQTLDEIARMSAKMRSVRDKGLIEEILNQFYSWTVRESFKALFIDNAEYREVCESFSKHKISYFQKEIGVTDVISRALREMGMSRRSAITEAAIARATIWFSYFTRELGYSYGVLKNGLRSKVVIA
jgi:hypothetical protein